MAALATCLVLLATAPGVVAEETASPSTVVVATPSTSPVPAATPVTTTYPLPDIVAETPPDIPTVSIAPTSAPSLEVGESAPFTLQHCGLLSPVDVDGSLWRPVGGVDATGGPIDTDDETSELINATSGLLTLVSADSARFTTESGLLILLERADGALDYPLCM